MGIDRTLLDLWSCACVAGPDFEESGELPTWLVGGNQGEVVHLQHSAQHGMTLNDCV